MTGTRISLFDPLATGWNRMVKMLFRPFDAGKWIVVAFAAWLAGLADGGKGGAQFGGGDGGPHVVEDARAGWDWLAGHEAMAGFIAAGLLALVALVVLVVWVSSRGKFVYLDNVIHDRAAIVEPWKRTARLGNSLFAFRLLVALVCIPVGVGLIGLFAWLAVGPDGWTHLEGAAAIGGVVGTAALACLFLLVAVYTFFFLDAFVVPLMYRFDLGVMDAWRRFLALLGARPWPFVLCGVFVLVLWLLVMAAVVTTGFMTCCLGFLLLAIPYVGTLLLLPILVTYRAFTVAFLAQFEPAIVFDPPSEPQVATEAR